jgi:hypothetical protein
MIEVDKSPNESSIAIIKEEVMTEVSKLLQKLHYDIKKNSTYALTLIANPSIKIQLPTRCSTIKSAIT